MEEKRNDIIVPAILVVFDFGLLLAIIFAFALKANDLSIYKMFGLKNATETIEATDTVVLKGTVGVVVEPNDDPGPGPDIRSNNESTKMDWDEPYDPYDYDADPEPSFQPIMDWGESDYDADLRPPILE